MIKILFTSCSIELYPCSTLCFTCFVKLNNSGKLLWQKSLGGNEYESVRSINQTKDGGYIVTGHTFSENGDITGNHGQNDFWVIKLSAGSSISKMESIPGSATFNTLKFTFSPNPASSLLDLNITSKEKAIQVRITNSHGNIMAEKNLFVNKGIYHHQLDVSKYPPGIYYVHLQSGNNFASEKFIKN